MTITLAALEFRSCARRFARTEVFRNLVMLGIALLLLADALPSAFSQDSKFGPCGPPTYPCSRIDTQVIVPEHPPQLGSNPKYYGGHAGAGMVAVDPAYGNAILRVTDGNTNNAKSFNTAASAEKNPWSYDESMFIVHDVGNQLCLFEFNAAAFQSTYHGCFNGLGKGGGVDFGYTQADNHKFYNYYLGKLHRYVVDSTTWTISIDPTFNNGKGEFDADAPNCLNGQIAANHWYIHDSALSSDDNTVIVAIGPQQDDDPYYVIWNATKGCQWLNVKTWQTSRGWNTGLSNPINVTWTGDVKPTGRGGIHNAQIDRSGTFGILTIHKAGLRQKMFWTIGTNNVDATCLRCHSHWACDFGVCFWDFGHESGFNMVNLPIGKFNAPQQDMNLTPVLGVWGSDEHASHANAVAGTKNIYLASWQPGKGGSKVTNVWGDEITGISWDGSQRTIRFNKHWNSGYGFWGTARCSISHLGHYAICGSDYQMYNLDKGFGNGKNQDTCDHTLSPGILGTNSCRTDLLLYELR
jgi:hypothetical protein